MSEGSARLNVLGTLFFDSYTQAFSGAFKRVKHHHLIKIQIAFKSIRFPNEIRHATGFCLRKTWL